MAETNGKLISELKVHELRSELIGRGLDGNGVKAALVARLEKALSEQGVDINSYLFASAADTNTTPATTTTTSIETQNNDGTAAAVVAASSKDETGKNKEAEEQKKEAVPENVVKTAEPQATTENKSKENAPLTADDLIEKVEDEIDEAELHGESEDVEEKSGAVNGNGNGNGDGSPDIGDLEEREESEGDDGKNESIPMETESENKMEQQQQQISAIHEISDEEDLDEDMLTDDAASQKPEKKEDGTKIMENKAEPVETKDKQANESLNKDEKLPAKPKIPAGLNFPSDDPNGLRCIWIRALPYETRLSELKLAFIDAGFTVESAKIFTTKQSSRPSAFGFMTLSSQDGAKNAVAKMNNSIFKGKVITVERASDASMLASSDLLAKSSKPSSDRPKVHPPIKPPEDDDKPVVPESNRSRIISTSRSSRSHDNSHSRSERHRSPYMNTVNRSRIIRAEPQRIVETSGRSIRVVTTRDSSRSSRPSRHSPVHAPRRDHRERTPPRRERTPPRRHRTPEHERIADKERRKFEDIMRKKEEEYKRKEEALRIEAERNRIKLEKERLEKENLELKLRLQQEQLRAASNTSSSRRGPSPPSSSRHRGNTPPQRRSPPPRSSRHASPPQQHPSSRRSPERHESRHHTSSKNYRQEPPPKESYPARRHSRSRSPVRAAYDRPRQDEYSRSSRPVEHGSSRHARAASPVRNVPPPPPSKYERHSPRRNYESSRSIDRSRRSDKTDITYPPMEEPQRSSRSSRNGGGGSGRDFPPNNYDRPNNGNSSFESTRRESGNHFIAPPPANIPATTFNLPTVYRSTAVNPSYSSTPGSSRNQLPTAWPQQQQQNYPPPNQQPQTWAHQPQNIANVPQWNPFTSSGGGGMRGSNGNQRYDGF